MDYQPTSRHPFPLDRVASSEWLCAASRMRLVEIQLIDE